MIRVGSLAVTMPLLDMSRDQAGRMWERFLVTGTLSWIIRIKNPETGESCSTRLVPKWSPRRASLNPSKNPTSPGGRSFCSKPNMSMTDLAGNGRR